MSQKLIELFPYGLSVGASSTRPVLLLRDQSQKHTLPVWLGQVEAAAAMSALNVVSPQQSPHRLLQKLMLELKLQLQQCVFSEMSGHRQYVDVDLTGPEKTVRLRLRADECMSACLTQKARFFTTPEMIEQAKKVDAEIAGVEQHLRAQPKLRQKNHTFLM